MNLGLHRTALCLLVALMVLGCNGSQGDQAALETQMASAIDATLTAYAPSPTAPVITVVVTPEPPEPTQPPPTSLPTDTPAPPPTSLPTDTPAPPPASLPTNTPALPPATGQKTRIDLAPAGGGDYPSLADAIANAPAGAQIYLEPGWYTLEEPITVDRALSLFGTEGQTVIVSTAAEQVLKFEGPGPFVAEGIAFQHDGAEPANVVVVLGGEVDFAFCSFEGGVFSETAGYGGSGLFLGGSTTGRVYGCEMMRNQAEGLLLREGAQVTVTQSRLHHNGDCGIGYFDQAAGAAQSNDASSNEHGICLLGSAAPFLQGNTARYNESTGIAYYDQAGGEARENDCSLNGHAGISLQGQASPLLEDNLCFANGEVDLAYYETAGGTARGNLCSTDAPFGLYVAETANPSLADNQCLLSGAAQQAGGESIAAPRYNPDALQNTGPLCFNRPQPAIDREWQTAAGTRSVLLYDSVELSLRNKWGEPDEVYQVTVRVVAPDGTETSAVTTLRSDEDAILVYPGDFGGSTGVRGAYTVIWEIEGGFIACDGFVTFGGAS
jgi:parallel beta-helix repeat protein